MPRTPNSKALVAGLAATLVMLLLYHQSTKGTASLSARLDSLVASKGARAKERTEQACPHLLETMPAPLNALLAENMAGWDFVRTLLDPSADKPGHEPSAGQALSCNDRAQSAPPPPRGVQSADKAWCEDAMAKHDVRPGSAWGTMVDTKDRGRWGAIPCSGVSDKFRASPAIKWCAAARKEYNVVSGEGMQHKYGFGDCKGFCREAWAALKCDTILPKPKRIAKVRNATVCKGDAKKQDMIAVCFGSTTRGLEAPSPASMSLFRYLLPSVQETAECGFRYGVFIGYDVGDPWWDVEATRAANERWFDREVAAPLRKVNILADVHFVPATNTIKKPGPVFTAVTQAAYKAGATYIYRINDDTEFLSTNWSSSFANELLSMGPPYGVLGPVVVNPHGTSDGANNDILTHDFTHRTHMEIFNLRYYPEELVDWWMDDWITFVYGKSRTRQGRRHAANHHTGVHGMRYEVDQGNKAHLQKLITTGANTIADWMDKNGVDGGALLRKDTRGYRGHVPPFKVAGTLA